MMQASGAHRTDIRGQARCRHRHATAALAHSPITRAWCRTRAGRTTLDSLADIPLLCDEIGRLDAAISLVCPDARPRDRDARRLPAPRLGQSAAKARNPPIRSEERDWMGWAHARQGN
jgi:hypothetical protein